MKIGIGDYIICNMGEGNEIVYVQDITAETLSGIRFCAINSGTGQFPIWTDPTKREYPLSQCRLFCKSIKKENLGEIGVK